MWPVSLSYILKQHLDQNVRDRDELFEKVLSMWYLQVEKKLSNNVNKALVIDYSDSRLISCGSLFQGKFFILFLL